MLRNSFSIHERYTLVARVSNKHRSQLRVGGNSITKTITAGSQLSSWGEGGGVFWKKVYVLDNLGQFQHVCPVYHRLDYAISGLHMK